MSFLFLEGITLPFRDDTGILSLDNFLIAFIVILLITAVSYQLIIIHFMVIHEIFRWQRELDNSQEEKFLLMRKNMPVSSEKEDV